MVSASSDTTDAKAVCSSVSLEVDCAVPKLLALFNCHFHFSVTLVFLMVSVCCHTTHAKAVHSTVSFEADCVVPKLVTLFSRYFHSTPPPPTPIVTDFCCVWQIWAGCRHTGTIVVWHMKSTKVKDLLKLDCWGISIMRHIDDKVCVCYVCVCVWERECVVCVSKSVCVVCVCVRERICCVSESVCVVCVCVCFCVCVVCVCVCVRECGVYVRECVVCVSESVCVVCV